MRMDGRLTLLDDGHIAEVAARFTGNGVRLSAADVSTTLGWEFKPQGLCRGSLCVPVRDASTLKTADGIDLVALAQLLSRPLALDVAARVAYLAASAAERGADLATLRAPEFSLPDLSGQRHSLSDYRGKKVLLVAYASW
jgi:AhpC/TSA family